ncbi:CDF-like metal transporter [Suillus ampliporus]|nr:CDF-like metal transporter [Suillus ampliporus]
MEKAVDLRRHDAIMEQISNCMVVLRLRVPLFLVISVLFFVTEIAIGFRAKSLALIADALQEKGKRTPQFSYAFHRGELVGAFFNGVFLLAQAFSIFLQAIERFVDVQPVDQPVYVLIVGCVGFALNVAVQGSLHTLHNHTNLPTAASQTNLGALGVLIHLLGDAVNNIGVIISAIIIWKATAPSRFYADPAVSMMISFIIFGSAIPLTRRSGRILLEAAPANLNLQLVREDLQTVPGYFPYMIYISGSSLNRVQLKHTLYVSIVLALFTLRVSTGTDLANWEHTEENPPAMLRSLRNFSCYNCSRNVNANNLRLLDAELEMQGPRAACDDGFGCPADDADLLRMRKRAVWLAHFYIVPTEVIRMDTCYVALSGISIFRVAHEFLYHLSLLLPVF